jgi:hypothetical protein
MKPRKMQGKLATDKNQMHTDERHWNLIQKAFHMRSSDFHLWQNFFLRVLRVSAVQSLWI